MNDFLTRGTVTRARLTVTALMMAGLTQAAHAQRAHPLGTPVVTPEPSSWVAFAIGGVCLGLLAIARSTRKHRMSE